MMCFYVDSNDAAMLLMTNSWTSTAEMAESQGDSTTSSSVDAAAAAGATAAGWYQMESTKYKPCKISREVLFDTIFKLIFLHFWY